jgi:hypothetical protein
LKENFTAVQMNNFCSCVNHRLGFFINRVVSYWNALSKKVDESQALDEFKRNYDN